MIVVRKKPVGIANEGLLFPNVRQLGEVAPAQGVAVVALFRRGSARSVRCFAVGRRREVAGTDGGESLGLEAEV